MVPPEKIALALQKARQQLGKPYRLGAKWALSQEDPQGPIDCSGFARWVLGWCGIFLPDGSYNQIKVCKKEEICKPLLLGFAALGADGAVDHVVIDEGTGENVIEARGAPYNAVIERPRTKWLAQKGFLGFFAPPGLYDFGAD